MRILGLNKNKIIEIIKRVEKDSEIAEKRSSEIFQEIVNNIEK